MTALSYCKVTIAESGALLADRVRAAHTHWTRLRGLLGTRTLEPRGGLWLAPCRQVHMIGMQYAIDVAFLDDDLRVVQTVAELPPWRISPKVDDATSVLELPAGRLAALGVASGARLAIDATGAKSAAASSSLAAAFVNLLLASTFAFFAAVHLSVGMSTGRWLTLGPIVLQETALVAVFLMRRRTNAVATERTAWLAAVIGTFVPLLLRPADPVGWVALGAPIQCTGVLLALLALTSLGRSFGLVPAHRGIQTDGLYSFIRHPMYAAHLVGYLGYVISYPSPRNAVILLATAIAINVRVLYEERLLGRDPVYAAYLQRVAWRFLPHLY